MNPASFQNLDFSQQINQMQDKYVYQSKRFRSTNNSQRQLCNIARTLFFRICTKNEKEQFEKEFKTCRNPRMYFLIICAHIRIRMRQEYRKRFQKAFSQAISRRIQIYNNKISESKQTIFLRQRFQEIADLQIAIKAIELYFSSNTEEAIESLYKKDGSLIYNRKNCDTTIKTILEIQKKLTSFPPGHLFPQLNLDKLYTQPIAREITDDMLLDSSITQENKKSKPISSQDEEWLIEHDREKKKKKLKRKISRQEKIFKTLIRRKSFHPLSGLQNSYPIFPQFYQIVFNHDLENEFQTMQNLGKLAFPPKIETNNSLKKCLQFQSKAAKINEASSNQRQAVQKQQTKLNNQVKVEQSLKEFQLRRREDKSLDLRNQHFKSAEPRQCKQQFV